MYPEEDQPNSFFRERTENRLKMSVLDLANKATSDPGARASRLERLFEELSDATTRGNLSEALRLADAARRVAPTDTTIAVVYARLLLDCGGYEQAIGALAGLEIPSARAARAEAFCHLGRGDEAIALCAGLLASHAVDCVDGLQRALNLICESRPERFSGWIALDSEGFLLGSARAGSRLEWNAGHVPGQLWLPAAPGAAPVAFREPFRLWDTGTLAVDCSTGPLLGSPIVWPERFGCAGWVLREDAGLRGEVSNAWAPGRAETLVVTSRSATRHFVLPPLSDGSADHEFAIPFSRELGVRVEVAVLLPDGKLAPLLGSPISRFDAREVSPIAARPPRLAPGRAVATARLSEVVDIVVPAYAGREETLRCIESVLATVSSDEAELVVVNDASPDPELRAALKQLARNKRITLLSNARNRGFPAAANRGMRLHPGRDVVLLNADCEVYGDWLARLRSAANSGTDIASVTPLGEQASIATYFCPSTGGEGFESAQRIDAVARKVNAGRFVEAPVGVGFCMYLRRGCLAEVGQFEDRLYGRGYGEENDFCLRARRKGWRHMVATDVFVRHSGGRSFGEERELLKARHGRVLNARHPGYDALVADYVAQDPLLPARRAIDLQCLLDRIGEPVLLVTHALGGGIQRAVDRRAAELQSAGHSVLMLQPVAGPRPGIRLQLLGNIFENLRFDLPSEAGALSTALRALKLEGLEIHHLLHLPPPTLELLLGLGVPYRMFLHDYSWVCPRLSLLGGDGRYCGEPAVEACETCVRTHGSAIRPPITVAALRARSAALLDGAAEVAAATNDVRTRYLRYFPQARISVKPWADSSPVPRRATPARQGRARIAVIGAINEQKGLLVLLECARAAARRDLPLEFILIGYSSDDAALLDTGRIFISGPYQESELGALLLRERCQAALFPSVTPETWCFALTHALADGMPIVAFDIGAIAERLRGSAGTTLLPLDAPVDRINESLLQASDQAAAAPALPAPRLAPPGGAPEPARAYASEKKDADAAEQAASVQMLRLPAGVYAFSIRSGARAGAHGEDMAQPALQVGLAPVQPKGAVEFYCGRGTVDRWLAFADDRVIARVTGESAGILLTSLRRPQDAALSIDVRRLDVRLPADTATGPQPQLLVHVRRLGDLHFPASSAGSLGPDLWIEAFVLEDADPTGAARFEYRGVTADGYETPWLSDGVLCGSRGRSMPLFGFAVRPRVAFRKDFECSYFGHFGSGRSVGPVGEGELCRSDLPDDPLEGMAIRITRR